MVKELVLRYDFRVFILEAEYIPCSKINAYVRSGVGSPEDLLKDVLLWPWIHRNFLEVIDWIRNYNKRHPFDQVSFLGMDSQLSKLYATKDSILTYYPEKGKSIITVIESESKPKRKIKRLRSLSQEIKKRTKEIDLRLHYYISCRINRLANSSYRDLSARDENMAYFVNL
jgi:erythromycin esterase-like protein